MNKVLVADDTKNIRVLLMKCLQMEGYEVRTANDGYEAIECLLNEEFDLAFIDIKMPGLSGTEVIRAIREKGIPTPVIVITAYATVKNAVECTQMGAVAYLQKPFTADKIRSVLKEYFDEAVVQLQGPDQTRETARKLVENGEFPKALKPVKDILSRDPGDPEAYLLLSKVYGGLGNSDMENKFKQAYKIFKEN